MINIRLIWFVWWINWNFLFEYCWKYWLDSNSLAKSETSQGTYSVYNTKQKIRIQYFRFAFGLWATSVAQWPRRTWLNAPYKLLRFAQKWAWIKLISSNPFIFSTFHFFCFFQLVWFSWKLQMKIQLSWKLRKSKMPLNSCMKNSNTNFLLFIQSIVPSKTKIHRLFLQIAFHRISQIGHETWSY